jgi:hypothetical protein
MCQSRCISIKLEKVTNRIMHPWNFCLVIWTVGRMWIDGEGSGTGDRGLGIGDWVLAIRSLPVNFLYFGQGKRSFLYTRMERNTDFF